jgi:hypothetical protein
MSSVHRLLAARCEVEQGRAAELVRARLLGIVLRPSKSLLPVGLSLEASFRVHRRAAVPPGGAALDGSREGSSVKAPRERIVGCLRTERLESAELLLGGRAREEL